ncbi:5'-AMP-activated protein kinase gamma-1 subunit [Thecamonas trahens ATCC 50062]|uniref:5'-AMP-activated protein kinase gamma-1 subunit n=1 Tax=Thecamonas trahens ATCC 50062 TaxID=461836 RepID=A0A0L0D322_THETB|nr:5'-AMP-activated protein kinase gamma-1 subunit [Thecamonas trahens ATCC 50062]KNC46566.1 5'-AMP-activated protein kinase gamma-1 subunit [Thecamonas trahens ATCC 50062]|eukprot:XP_013760343.1 5'-AMP-activated protein kinase gamma-1 subunit [Thecamonas trahens ATCC 50062]
MGGRFASSSYSDSDDDRVGGSLATAVLDPDHAEKSLAEMALEMDGIEADESGSRTTPEAGGGGDDADLAGEDRRDDGVFDPRWVYRDALRKVTTYDLLPESSKVVVLDTRLLVKDAFQVLVENNVRSAPLWEAERRAYVGLISMTDFIAVLKHFYRSPLAGMDELVEYSISRWRELAASDPDAPGRLIHKLVYAEPTDNLLHTALMLLSNGTNTILAILTHWDIIDAATAAVSNTPPFMDESIFDLGVGVFKSVITISAETPLIVVLNIFFERRISAIPIIDATGVVIDVYSKSDVYDLARAQAYDNLDISVHEALQYRLRTPSVHTCSKHDSLASVIDTIRATHAHRLICVDSTSRIVGIVSITDLLTYISEVKA